MFNSSLLCRRSRTTLFSKETMELIVAVIFVLIALVFYTRFHPDLDEERPASPNRAQLPAAGQTGAGQNAQPPADNESPAAPNVAQSEPPRRQQQMSFADWLTEKAPSYIGRLGIVFLVIGLAFAVGYSWEFITAQVKVALGFLGAVGLIALGEFVMRKPSLTWYGHAIVGGGYALASFVAYAAQNIDSVKVIDDPVGSAIIMLLLSFVAMAHAVVRRSEWLALFASLLGLVTIGLSPATGFTLAATTVMLMAHQQVVMRKRWMSATIFALIGSYANFILFNWPSIADRPEMLISYLALFWASWDASLLGFYHQMQRKSPEQQLINRFVAMHKFPYVLVAAGAVNTLLFLVGAFRAVPSDAGWLWLVLVGLGSAHLVSAFFAHRFQWKLRFEVQMVAALCLMALGVALKLTEDVLVVLWFAIPVLHFAAMRAQVKGLSYLAGLITMAALAYYPGAGFTDRHAVFFGVQYNIFVGGFAIASMAATAFLFSRLGFGDQNESQMVSRFHGLVAVGIALFLTVVEVPSVYAPLVLALEALVLLVVARRASFFLAGLLLMLSAVAMLVTQYESAQPLVTVTVFAAAFLPRLLHKLDMLPYKRSSPAISLGLVDVMALYAAVGMLALTVLKLDGPWAATGVACEMVALVVAGIALRDSIVRSTGHLGIVASFYCLFHHAPWTWGMVIPIVVGLWLTYGIFRSGFADRASGDPEFCNLALQRRVQRVW